VTVFLCDGTHDVLDINGTGVWGPPSSGPIMPSLSALLDPTCTTIQTINWPDALLPMGGSIEQGVHQLTAAIQRLTTPFILVGYSQGGAVVSLVLNEILSGSLTTYQPLLLAGVTFGNICRQEGKFAPVQTDPGGHGLWGDHLLTNTPSYWWDFALVDDLATTITDDAYGLDVQAVCELLVASYYGAESIVQFITDNLLDLPGDILSNLEGILDVIDLVAAMLGLVSPLPGIQNLGPHGEYAFDPPPGATSTLTCVQMAANYINETADQR
jgi:PE-PPE domain